MRRWLFALGLLLPGVAQAVPTQTQSAPMTPLVGSQMGLTVATATTLTYPAGATTAVCTVEGQSVRWRDDGQAPTASVGQLAQIGSILTIRETNMTSTSNFQVIQTASSATLDCSYYR